MLLNKMGMESLYNILEWIKKEEMAPKMCGKRLPQAEGSASVEVPAGEYKLQLMERKACEAGSKGGG